MANISGGKIFLYTENLFQLFVKNLPSLNPHMYAAYRHAQLQIRVQ